MKNLKFILSSILILFIFNTTLAQKTDALQKKAMEDEMNLSKNKVNPSKIPNKYSFSWKYSMEMKTTTGKSVVFDYLLEPNSNYYGANMHQSGSEMFMIMDMKNKLTISSFGKGSKKMAMASRIPDYTKTNEEQNSKFTYKTLPNKTILGYNCKGVQATNSNSTMVFYYTNEAKVSFSEIFRSQQNQNTPDAFKSFFKPGEKPLMMYMEHKDLKDKSKNMSMKCIALEKEAFIFNKSDYQFM